MVAATFIPREQRHKSKHLFQPPEDESQPSEKSSDKSGSDSGKNLGNEYRNMR
jgi:hypothetical protein